MSWTAFGSTVRYTHLMMATNIQSKHQQQPNRTEKLTPGQMCIRTAVYFMHTINGGDKRRERGSSHPYAQAMATAHKCYDEWTEKYRQRVRWTASADPE